MEPGLGCGRDAGAAAAEDLAPCAEGLHTGAAQGALPASAGGLGALAKAGGGRGAGKMRGASLSDRLNPNNARYDAALAAEYAAQVGSPAARGLPCPDADAPEGTPASGSDTRAPGMPARPADDDGLLCLLPLLCRPSAGRALPRRRGACSLCCAGLLPQLRSCRLPVERPLGPTSL